MRMRTTTITGRVTIIPMGIEPQACPAPQLAMMWLSSPALPVGGFSYSEGLEAAVDAVRQRFGDGKLARGMPSRME